MKHDRGVIGGHSAYDKDIEVFFGDITVSVDHDDVDLDESESLARLIASAPELLEALKDLETWWRKRNDERTIEAIEPVMIKALDAIAKATGGIE